LLDSLRAGKNCVAEEFQTITAGYRASIEDWLKKAIPGVLECKWSSGILKKT
jgi:hypothetical protein